MVIEKISIGKFGKFENKTLVFSEGINLIEGENESGKSTVFAFLRFMFYGLSESPSADGLSDRQKYTGMWEGKAFGTLEFSCSKGRFRIERKLGMGGKGAPKEEVAIIDLQLSTPIKGTDPAALFLGVPEEVFLRSCFLDQLCCQPIGSEHLGRAVENMLSSSDESVNALNSAGKLQKELELLEGEDGQIAEKNALLSDLRLRMAKTREQEEEYKRLLQNLKENRKKIENNRKDLAECQREVGYTDALRRVALLKRAGKAAEELQAAQGELENLQKEFGCRSFYPTKAYVKELASYAMDGQMLLTGISEGEERIKALQSEVEALPVFSGGQEELLSSISALEKRRDGLKIKRLAVLGLAGIGAILTVIFLTTKLFLGAGISGAVALICAAVSEVLRRRMRSAEEETDKIYESVGAKNRAEVTSSVARNAAKAAKRETLLGSLEETAAKLKKDRASLDKILGKANASAGLWGRAVKTGEDLRRLALEAEEALERRKTAEEKERQAKTQLSALEMPGSPEELKRLFETVKENKDLRELTPAEYKDRTVKIKFYTQTVEALGKRVETQERRVNELEKEMEDYGELAEEEKKTEAEWNRLCRRQKVLTVARDTILETMSYMKEQILPGVLSEAEKFLKTATSGKYGKLSAGENFRLSVADDEGRIYPITALSCGTAELCYIALRFGMTTGLFGGQPMPFVFDESFAHLDDLHLAAAFLALKERAEEKKDQIFLATCRKRDASLLLKIVQAKEIRL